MAIDDQRLTLARQGVFGWTMYPGYGDGPYRSPIIVEEVTALGGRTLDLRLLNIFYAAGVQEMTYRLRTLRRERTFQISEVIEHDGLTERVVILEPMTPTWIEDLAPKCIPHLNMLFDPLSEPIPEAFKALAATTF